jgi:hypothetical protein
MLRRMFVATEDEVAASRFAFDQGAELTAARRTRPLISSRMLVADIRWKVE